MRDRLFWLVTILIVVGVIVIAWLVFGAMGRIILGQT
jgi:hypothetical protein